MFLRFRQALRFECDYLLHRAEPDEIMLVLGLLACLVGVIVTPGMLAV
ncbi:hypothetical protein HYS28_00695 [Candidatus Uhrbacteria bacterium]|nr:hypothetical protein [Candidatus Uhrbacteria bacterium]